MPKQKGYFKIKRTTEKHPDALLARSHVVIKTQVQTGVDKNGKEVYIAVANAVPRNRLGEVELIKALNVEHHNALLLALSKELSEKLKIED